MKISVKNLGVIKEANNIEIKDFNVFIGANGSGKTYFAKLIYFLCNNNYKASIFNELFEKKLNKIYETKTKEIIFSIEEQKKYVKAFEFEIRKNFSKFLDSKNTHLFDNIKFNVDFLIYKDIKIHLKNNDEFSNNFLFENYTNFLWGLNKKDDKYIKIIIPEELDGYKHNIDVMIFFTYAIFSSIQSYYLPSARANFMITYKHLFESQFNKLREVMLNKSNKEVNLFPEIEHRFLQSIFNLNTKVHTNFYSIANKIEKELFRDGKLSIRNPQTQDLPSFDYKIKNKKIPIDLTLSSSAISELSPLVMYFRHIATKNDLLVIDEPELSLHPDAQAKLIEILVEAVNMGLKLILVTHSPYILEALNIHLKRDKIKNIKLPKDIKKIEPFESDRVGAYLFEDETIKDILDKKSGLIDDKLLNSLNNIDTIYEKMRDIEWEARENE